MKITRRRLRQIIKEEISRITEASSKQPDFGMQFEFKRGRSNITNDGTVPFMANPPDPKDIARYLGMALTSDRQGYDPIKVRAGVSGTGSKEANERVLNKRITGAFKYLAQIIKDAGLRGAKGFEYDADSLKNLANVSYDIELLGPGESLEHPPRSGVYVTAPDDPDHPYYIPHQYVEITLQDPGVAPIYVLLADEFVKVTIESLMPTYSGIPSVSVLTKLLSNVRVTYSDKIYNILDQLRDGNDFHKFNEEVTKISRGKDFYDIACENAVTIPKTILGVKVPSWLGGGAGLGPKEIGENITEINSLLTNKFGVDPIVC